MRTTVWGGWCMRTGSYNERRKKTTVSMFWLSKSAHWKVSFEPFKIFLYYNTLQKVMFSQTYFGAFPKVSQGQIKVHFEEEMFLFILDQIKCVCNSVQCKFIRLEMSDLLLWVPDLRADWSIPRPVVTAGKCSLIKWIRLRPSEIVKILIWELVFILINTF